MKPVKGCARPSHARCINMGVSLGRGVMGDTYRLRVPGGWLYRGRECANRDCVPPRSPLRLFQMR